MDNNILIIYEIKFFGKSCEKKVYFRRELLSEGGCKTAAIRLKIISLTANII